MKILDLSLKYIWYDMIERGEKTEEYREQKEYYYNRFFKSWIGGFVGVVFSGYKHYDAVRFHRGQGGKETMLFECKGITIGYGKPEWGAPENRTVFIIRLGERIK